MRDFGLATGDDDPVWQFARTREFVIVTKDDDFRQLSFLRGAPPKVIWVRLGNCRTADVEAVLRTKEVEVASFVADTESALLVLTREPPALNAGGDAR